MQEKKNTPIIARYVRWFELGLLCVILIVTTISLLEELWAMYLQRIVKLSDVLLLFIYLEVYAMVGIYYATNSLPVRYPIYIAIVALARYVTIEAKELSGLELVYISIAIVLLALAVLSVRFGHIKFPYPKRNELLHDEQQPHAETHK